MLLKRATVSSLVVHLVKVLIPVIHCHLDAMVDEDYAPTVATSEVFLAA